MFDQLGRTIDEYASSVGFSRTIAPSRADEIETPAGAALWSADYAKLLLWPATSASGADLSSALHDAVAWFDVVLSQAEVSGRGPVDGYLALALPSKPDDESCLDLVRVIESSPRVCRKHVIWPDQEAEGSWRGLLSITVLGLPTGANAGDSVDWPLLDDEQQKLWERVAAGYREAAAEDLEGLQS
jgi:hypothetical protein